MARRQRARPRPPLQPLSLLEAELEGAAVKNSFNIRCVNETIYAENPSQSFFLDDTTRANTCCSPSLRTHRLCTTHWGPEGTVVLACQQVSRLMATPGEGAIHRMGAGVARHGNP